MAVNMRQKYPEIDPAKWASELIFIMSGAQCRATDPRSVHTYRTCKDKLKEVTRDKGM